MARFTDRELDIMNVLWQHGPATVAEVRARLDDDLAYTTVQTMLRILEQKGHVSHTEEGKAHRFAARVAEKSARRTALARMVDRVFGGSAELLLTQLVADRDLTPEELERLRALMDRQINKRSGKP
jgi:BlaI family transcriptional regulator, penicillinase repressor